jgi:hypothetical protein
VLRRTSLKDYAVTAKPSLGIGRRRMRLPVATKIAFVTAGAMGGRTRLTMMRAWDRTMMRIALLRCEFIGRWEGERPREPERTTDSRGSMCVQRAQHSQSSARFWTARRPSGSDLRAAFNQRTSHNPLPIDPIVFSKRLSAPRGRRRPRRL